MERNYITLIQAILRTGSFTQAQLAARLGVTFAALNRWLNGHAVPHTSRIRGIERLHRETVFYPSITTQNIARLIQRAGRFRSKKMWDRIVATQTLQDELILEHTYNSTTIEGATFTKKETEAVIFDKSMIRDKSLIEHLEVANHAALLRDILTKKYTEPVTENLIQTFHARLMQGIRPDAGLYSKNHRAIRGVNIILTHPKDIAEEMGTLMKSWRRGQEKLSDLQRIVDFHTRFELIHPFGDGNGRVGRLVMVLQCLESSYPPVVIENDRKAEYYDVLEYAQRKHSAPFIAFVCEEMGQTYKIISRFLKKGRHDRAS